MVRGFIFNEVRELCKRFPKQIALFLPLTYAIQDIRAAVLAEATFGELAADLQKLTLFAIIMPLLGWATFYLTERRARRLGTLGQH